MKGRTKEDIHEFSLSELSDNSIKKISETKDAVIKLWYNEEGSYGASHNKKIKFNEVIKQIYVCLPNIEMPGHSNDINFLIEFNDNLPNEINKDKFRIGGSLKRGLGNILKDINVNVYSKDDVIDKTKSSSMLPESSIQHNKAIAYAGIPISEFNCQTLGEFHEQTHTNFQQWQAQQMSSSLKSSPVTVTVGGESKDIETPPISSKLEKEFNPLEIVQKKILAIPKTSQEKFSSLAPEVQSEITKGADSLLQGTDLFLKLLEKFDLLDSSNNQANSPKSTVKNRAAQPLQSNVQQGLSVS